MRILFSTPVLRNPPFGGPQLRIENSIKALSKISELYIYCRTSPEYIGGAKALSFYQDYCKAFFFAPSFVSPHNYIRFLKRLVNYVAGQTIRREYSNLRWNRRIRTSGICWKLPMPFKPR